jgi:phosphoheptose isomerase
MSLDGGDESMKENSKHQLSQEQMVRMLEQLKASQQQAIRSMLGEGPSLSEVTAHHEASHAVTAVHLGIEFDHVYMSIYQHTAQAGDIVGGLSLPATFRSILETSDPANEADQEMMEKLVKVAIAGEAGQAVLEQRACDMRQLSAEGDYEIVQRLARKLYPDKADRVAFVERQIKAAQELVSDRLCNRQIESVAMLLRNLHEVSYLGVVERMELVCGWMADPEFESSADE